MVVVCLDKTIFAFPYKIKNYFSLASLWATIPTPNIYSEKQRDVWFQGALLYKVGLNFNEWRHFTFLFIKGHESVGNSDFWNQFLILFLNICYLLERSAVLFEQLRFTKFVRRYFKTYKGAEQLQLEKMK